MNNTLNKRILSPLQPKVKPVIDVRGENHPVREEVKKLCGNPFSLEVSFQEDTDTLKNLNIPGLVGVLCILKLNGKIIAFGRSVSVFSKLNKYIERTISASIGGSFLSAANNAIKVLESIRANGGEETEEFEEIEEPASEKQRSYLKSLLGSEADEDEINALTKDQASERIQELVN